MNIRDIYKLDLQTRKETYGSQDVQKVIIDGITFTGYKTYTFYWEKTYSEEPERSLGGVINNLNSVPFFITPRLRINFSMMSIDDYRKLYSLILSKNEFTVTCYNVLTNEPITQKMYFEPDDFPTLYMVARKLQGDGGIERWQEITGVRDYVVTMNGTNASLSTISISYNANPPSGVSGEVPPNDGEPDFALNTDVIIGYSSSIPKSNLGGDYVFDKWNTKPDGSGNTYLNGQVYFINDAVLGSSNTLVLYAQWKRNTTYTLNFSYGLSTPEIVNGKERLNEEVQNGSVITLPTIDSTPQVTYDGATYEPYENGGWYTTPIKVNNSVKLSSPYTYNKNSSSTIYCLYDTTKYTLTYHTNSSNIQLSNVNLAYGETIPKPTLYEQGKTFKGWVWTVSGEDEKQPFNKTTMPPYDVEIYAKWE